MHHADLRNLLSATNDLPPALQTETDFWSTAARADTPGELYECSAPQRIAILLGGRDTQEQPRIRVTPLRIKSVFVPPLGVTQPEASTRRACSGGIPIPGVVAHHRRARTLLSVAAQNPKNHRSCTRSQHDDHILHPAKCIFRVPKILILVTEILCPDSTTAVPNPSGMTCRTRIVCRSPGHSSPTSLLESTKTMESFFQAPTQSRPRSYLRQHSECSMQRRGAVLPHVHAPNDHIST